MRKIWNCRRSMLALIAMILLTGISIYNKIDTSMAIAAIIAAVAGSNAYQARGDHGTVRESERV